MSKVCVLLVLALCLTTMGCSSSSEEEIATFDPTIATPEMIPSPSAVDRQEFDVVVAGNTIFTVWAERRSAAVGDTFDIWFSQAQVGQSLAAVAERVTNTAVDSRRPRLSVDSGGDALIVWEEGNSPTRDINVIRRAGGAFGAPGVFSIPADAEDDANPDIHVAGNDDVHVVWERSGAIIYRRQRVGAAADAEKTLPAANGLETSSQARRPSIISDVAGNIIVAWEAQQTIGTANVSLIRVAVSEDGGGDFNRAGRVDGSALVQGAFEPRLARSTTAMGFYIAFRTGRAGDTDFRVRVQRMSGFGISDDAFADVYQSSTDIPSGLDIVVQEDEVYTTWVDAGKARIRVSLNDNLNYGNIVSLAEFMGSVTHQRTAVSVSGDNLVTVFDAGNASERAGLLSASDISGRNSANP